ncbi:hypothetical protein AB9K35_06390 [Leisingera sp. XS_AS12]
MFVIKASETGCRHAGRQEIGANRQAIARLGKRDTGNGRRWQDKFRLLWIYISIKREL